MTTEIETTGSAVAEVTKDAAILERMVTQYQETNDPEVKASKKKVLENDLHLAETAYNNTKKKVAQVEDSEAKKAKWGKELEDAFAKIGAARLQIFGVEDVEIISRTDLDFLSAPSSSKKLSTSTESPKSGQSCVML
eukprot:TRINITY_DN3123_c0_g1_i1.p1 TRINITY_DN3123_c0_g1~~TRINITY_DN3123_c0_g1_i1.p1  ORF type:complete len:146 (+),score=12.54 TRINITY_DN3123_c0_g1_i1:28-438(+)